MNIGSTPPISHRVLGQARREIADRLRDISDQCDDLLDDTGCPMDHVMERLTALQAAAETAITNLARPYEQSGERLPVALQSLVRNQLKTAHKLNMLRTLRPLRQANFDAFGQDPDVSRSYRRITETIVPRPHLALEEEPTTRPASR